MFKKISFLLLAIMLSLSACAAAPRPSTDGYYNESASGAPVPAATMVAEAPAQASRDEQTSTVDATTTERLVIKNANLALVVKDPTGAVNTISALAEAAGGYVVNSSVTQISVDAQGNNILSGQVAIRVPAATLTDALAQIKALALTVKTENITGEDVTAQYVDLESQLTNLEAEALQLQKIMDSATKTEDVLTVYKELSSVQGQIEIIKGQMKYYRDAAAMSYISVSLEQEWISQPIETGGWKPEGVLKSITEAWVATYQLVTTLALWGGIFCLPILLVLGLIGGLIFLVVRGVARAARKSRKAPSA